MSGVPARNGPPESGAPAGDDTRPSGAPTADGTPDDCGPTAENTLEGAGPATRGTPKLGRPKAYGRPESRPKADGAPTPRGGRPGGGRALVLGGGGITGIAWEWGILSGLADAGIDLYGADLVVGTSAGSIVGAQVASGIDPEVRYQAQLAGANGELPARVGRAVMARWAWAALRSRSAEQVGARIGRLALAARTVTEAERRRVIESRLPVREWPDRPLKITAVDAATGALAVFDRAAGATLVEAVGASCAVPCVWPPVTIAGRRYIDGGVRSPANVDLAAGHRAVVVLAPSTGGFGPVASVGRQVAALRRAGTRVVVISPDRRSREAFGRNSLDPRARAPAARAGRAQAASAVAAVTAVWEDA